MKVDEYTFRKSPRDQRDYNDQSTLIFNFGKYSSQVVSTPPNWVARNGEFVFFSSSGTNRVYFYSGNQWNWFGGSPSGGGVLPGGDDEQIQVNSMDLALYADSGFVYKASSAVSIGRDMLMILNNNSGSNTYMLYRSSNTYIEYYVNGEIRLQM